MLKCERVASARGGVRRQAGDNGTREMIDKILLDEERHIDWAETQRELLAQLGLPSRRGETAIDNVTMRSAESLC